MQKNLSNKNLASQQIRFVQDVEGIGDILVFQTKQKTKNRDIIQSLQELKDILNKFISIKEHDPDRFEHLLLSQKFFDIHEKNPEEAKMQLAFRPEEHLIAFSTTINQVIRVHEAAIESNNSEVSRFATYILIWMLKDLAKDKENQIFVEQLLRALYRILDLAVDKDDSSMYPATSDWYTSIVFDFSERNKKSLDLEYVSQFNKHLFAIVKYIIKKDKIDLFQNLVSSLITGIHVFDYDEHDILEYSYLISHRQFDIYKKLDDEHKINNSIDNLARQSRVVSKKEDLDDWFKKFYKLKDILSLYFDSNEQRKAEELESKIERYVNTRYKFNLLLEEVFKIGAYCIFKEQPKYLKILWEYKQPPDSDASWVGHDILPNNLEGAIESYFIKGRFERDIDFWEDHHGSEKYFKEHFLLLLAKLLQNINPDNNGRYSQIESLNLPSLHVNRLSDIEYSAEDLIKYIGAVKNRTDFLRALGFNLENIDIIFDEKLPILLKEIKNKAQRRIEQVEITSPVSLVKIEKFKEDYIEAFNKSATVRNVLKHFGLCNSKLDLFREDLDKFGLFTLYPKAAFFDEWYVHYVNDGGDSGHNAGHSENLYILSQIEGSCQSSEKRFEEVLSELDISNLIIFANITSLYDHFHRNINFKSKWQLTEQSIKFKFEGFEGLYSFKDVQIPVFSSHEKVGYNQIVILDATKLGTLVQYAPTKDQREMYKDIFFMNIEAFSENKELLKQYLEAPPESLKKIETEQGRIDHLSKLVKIDIFEKLEFIKKESFSGYIINSF